MVTLFILSVRGPFCSRSWLFTQLVVWASEAGTPRGWQHVTFQGEAPEGAA